MIRRANTTEAIQYEIDGAHDAEAPQETSLVYWLDLPQADATVSGILDIAGWAFSAQGTVERVEAQIGHLPPRPLRYGIERPEVRETYPENPTLRCGFSGTIRLDDTLIGPQLLTVRIYDSDHRTVEIVRPIHVGASSAVMHIDAPRSGEGSGGGLLVAGWVFSFRAPIIRIEVFLGDELLGPINYGLPRPDLLALYDHPNAANCAFWDILSFPVASDRTETLRIRATDALGSHVEETVPLRLVTQSEASAEIERARWVADIMEAEGWCVLPSAEAPVVARIFLDDVFVGQTRLALSRPDLWRRYAKHPAAIRPGFRFRQAFELPPSVAAPANGDTLHTLAVEFIDRVGTSLRRTVHLAHESSVSGGDMAAVWSTFSRAVAEYQGYTGQDPAILDWHTQLGLPDVFPDLTFFTPPSDTAKTLPYLDRSIDLVIVAADDPVRLAEAERVAAGGVMRLRTGDVSHPEGRIAQVTTIDPVWHPASERSEGPFAVPNWSIIIPVFNHAALTQSCLAQLVATLPADPHGEVIVIDDASTDDTPTMLEQWTTLDSRILVLRNDENAGFLASCNRGAAAATGDVLVFLNNDTVPRPHWLFPLLRVLRDHPDAGAVGGKLLFPDGRLQEAGGVIYRDGYGCNFGKFDPAPNAPLYNHLRVVDYCSGALLATWRALFGEIGGFDSRYAPAYYEDVDYCFSLRSRGYATYYQPESEIVHLEGASSGTDLSSGVKQYQVINREQFVAKWATELKRQPLCPTDSSLASLYTLAVRDGGDGQDAD